MRTIEATEPSGQFKKVIDLAVNGEAILVSTPSRQSVVVLSEGEYKAMAKAQKNAQYQAKIEQSIADVRAGKVIAKTMEKLEAMAKTVCFMLPKSAIANLNQLAKEKGCSRTQYLVELFEDMFK